MTQALNGHTAEASQEHRKTSKRVRDSIRLIIRQAVDLKDLAYEAALSMKGQFDTDEAANRARAKAQAITGLTKSWSEAVDVLRIARGKPLPGSLRPEAKPKRRTSPQQGPAFTEE